MPSQRLFHELSILVSVVTFFLRCSSSTPSTYIPIERIAVGSSGGITGYGRGYRIERNGTSDEWELRGGNTFIITTAKLPASSVRRLFDHTVSLRLDTLDINETGNMTYWIEIATDKSIHRIRWSSSDHLPDDIVRWYDSLLRFCRYAVSSND